MSHQGRTRRLLQEFNLQTFSLQDAQSPSSYFLLIMCFHAPFLLNIISLSQTLPSTWINLLYLSGFNTLTEWGAAHSKEKHQLALIVHLLPPWEINHTLSLVLNKSFSVILTPTCHRSCEPAENHRRRTRSQSPASRLSCPTSRPAWRDKHRKSNITKICCKVQTDFFDNPLYNTTVFRCMLLNFNKSFVFLCEVWRNLKVDEDNGHKTLLNRLIMPTKTICIH